MADNSESRVWDILEKTSVGMLTTHGSQGLRARPLDARPDREAGVIQFVTDVRGLKDDEIEADSRVAAFEFAKARLIGATPDLGENRKVTVPLKSERLTQR